MSKTQASAPGKIILFGEHAVVYGEPAIAPEIRRLCDDLLARFAGLGTAPEGPIAPGVSLERSSMAVGERR